MNVSHFVKICQVLTILHQFICRGVTNFGTRCIYDQLWPFLWYCVFCFNFKASVYKHHVNHTTQHWLDLTCSLFDNNALQFLCYFSHGILFTFGAIFIIWAIFSPPALFLSYFSKYNHHQLAGTETRPCGGVVMFNSGGWPSCASGLWSVQFHRCAGHCLCQLDVRLIQTHVIHAEPCSCQAAACTPVDGRSQSRRSHMWLPLAWQIGAKHCFQQLKQSHQ